MSPFRFSRSPGRGVSAARAACRSIVLLVSTILLVASAGLATPPAGADGLVVNGGFEQPVVPQDILTYSAPASFAGWTVDRGSVDVTGLLVNGGWQAAGGQQSLDLSGTSAGSVHQDVPTSAGSRYLLTFWYAGDPTFTGSLGCAPMSFLRHMTVSWENAKVDDITVDTTGRTRASMGWQKRSLLVTATADPSRLEFTSLSEGWCGPTLDDVSVTPLTASQTFTTLASSASPSVASQPVTFTAAVVGGSASSHPAGSVRFEVDGTTAGAPVSLDANGQAGLTTDQLVVGSHTVRAVFEPSGGSEPSSGELVQAVTKAFSVTTVQVAPDPTVAGQDATFTASIAGIPPATAVPGGEVQFTEADGTPIGEPEPVVGGKATIVAWAGAGKYTVFARYLGDERFASSAGKVDQTVARADTTTTLTSDRNPVKVNEDVTFSVTVTTKHPGDVRPGGTVQILVDGVDASGPIPLFPAGPTQAGVEVEF